VFYFFCARADAFLIQNVFPDFLALTVTDLYLLMAYMGDWLYCLLLSVIHGYICVAIFYTLY